MAIQPGWGFCNQCFVMFYNGYSDKGVCLGGTLGHVMEGERFELPHDVPDNPHAQEEWRFCVKCSAMFFNGYEDKGHCAGGHGHDCGGSFNFVLPHDVPDNNGSQEGWFYCKWCKSMFFDGYHHDGRTGICPAHPGGHEGQGFNFVLPHYDASGDPPPVLPGQVEAPPGGFTGWGHAVEKPKEKRKDIFPSDPKRKPR